MGRRYRPSAHSAPLLSAKPRKPLAHRCRCSSSFEGIGDDGDEIVGETEVREVLERQVDGSVDGTGRTQAPELVELSFLAVARGHAHTVRESADPALNTR